MRIGFIGAGKAGCSFGKFITENVRGEAGDAAVSISGYYSRTFRSAEFAAELTGSRAFEHAVDLVSASDVIMLTVPDGAVAETWQMIRDLEETNGKTFCHMSGSLSSLVFGGSNFAPDGRGRCFCSLHPMLALADKELSWRKLDSAYFTFDGGDN
ncbi:MAG: NAD(P)-binding domain-containing protein, partial [Clostridiales Family XIII bacterium]|nr:NAD(P)-binding domain-containing protein [Clostridiales Family XIII bacterium]